MKLFKIVCRGSKLSLAQADIFKRKLSAASADTEVEIVIKETEGDTNQLQPLTEMEGKDFFTKDIQDYLLSGKADFAVHSLKDVSGENFFRNNSYAIIEREDVHDIAIFNEDVLNKIENGEKLRLGTSSPRRVEMAREFLLNALPRINEQKISIEPLLIRGNVDTRLRKLSAKEFDGIILACAGLNRLLRNESSTKEVSTLLENKRLMILPLLECPPAPGQGAIVAETSPENEEAKSMLRSLNDEQLSEEVSMERQLAHRFGSGCHQKFGAVHINIEGISFTYASGKDRSHNNFTETIPKDISLKRNVSISAHEIENLLNRQYINLITSMERLEQLNDSERNWVSSTALWYDLANKGLWIQGSCEGFGLKFIEGTVNSPLLSQTKN